MDRGPSQCRHPVLAQSGLDTITSLDLVQGIDKAYFLHLLATDPDTLVPPGKSLISLVTRERFGEGERGEGARISETSQRVAKVVHDAFWDATTEKLSSPIPADQNIHIQRLSNDLREAILPLLPSAHPLLHLLTFPPAPSISPLHSFIGTLRDVLKALAHRCAPIRDGEINAELQALCNFPPKETIASNPRTGEESTQSQRKDTTTLANFTVQSLKVIIAISDNMKKDLDNIVLGSMTEERLQVLVKREAKRREKELVLELWSLDSEVIGKRGEDLIRVDWCNWCNGVETTEASPSDKWKYRIIKSLSAPIPISCTPRSMTNQLGENGLPPQFFFSASSICQLQNFIQAIIITAVMRSLTRLPPPSLPSETSSVGAPTHDFIQRIWNLLQAELEITESDHKPLTIDSIADEVVCARRIVAGLLSEREEQHLREAVERTLQHRDPVFLLLQKRLMDALLAEILSRDCDGNSLTRPVQIAPEKLKTGRNKWYSTHGERGPKLIIGEGEVGRRAGFIQRGITDSLVQTIKGFEDPVLARAVNVAFLKLVGIVGWVEYVWGDGVYSARTTST